MKQKKYQAYKPSGIEWIGEIPSHWKLSRLKFLATNTIGITYSPDQVTSEGGTLVLRSSNIQQAKLSLEDCVFVTTSIPEKCVTKVGDILLCSRNGSADLVGKNILIDENIAGVTFGAFMTVVRSRMYPFLYWYFNSPLFKSQSGLFSSTTINQLTNDILSNMVVSFPEDSKEQQSISSYLTEKTAQIDSTIRKKEKLIELLQEERTAIINQAVTRGLDPNVKMKHSGVETIGDIPQGWSVAPLRWLCHVFAGGTPSRDNKEYWNSNDIPWLNSGEVNKEIIKQSDNYISQTGYENSSAKWIKPGSVLMALAGQGKTKGTVAALEIPATCNQSMAAIEPDPKRVNYKQLFYYLKSRYQDIRGLVGDDRDGLNLEHVKSIKVPLPTMAEQEAITSYLDKKTALIESTISNKVKEINLLQEYRTALINEVVTGKRCVI